MYQEYLEKIKSESGKYGERMRPPATEAALARLSDRAREELSAEVPEQYKDFLRVMDGLNHNGLFIYSSRDTDDYEHGFVETNLNWRSYEINDDFVYFADADIDLYVYSLPDREYQVLDRPSMDVNGAFKTFDEMITEALKKCII